jgi:hypothetical protein
MKVPYMLLTSIGHKWLRMISFKDVLREISAIRAEKDTQERLKMLQHLNESLPIEMKLQFPSLITNAYIRRALDKIEEKVLVSA